MTHNRSLLAAFGCLALTAGLYFVFRSPETPVSTNPGIPRAVTSPSPRSGAVQTGIPRMDRKVESIPSVPGTRTNAASSGHSRTAGTAAHTPPTTPIPRLTTARNSRPGHSSDQETGMTGESAVEPAPMGLRLAPDVRLPAAALPMDKEISPVAQKALQGIVDDYYRELAAAVMPVSETTDDSSQAASTPGTIEVAENGDRTLVVPNGPAAEAARKYADYRFRALFGNAAYNRMTMNSVLDAHMPVANSPSGAPVSE